MKFFVMMSALLILGFVYVIFCKIQGLGKRLDGVVAFFVPYLMIWTSIWLFMNEPVLEKFRIYWALGICFMSLCICAEWCLALRCLEVTRFLMSSCLFRFVL